MFLYVVISQNFTDAVVQRFQNINPEKEGATITGTSCLKNEIQIMTLPDDLWIFWQRFLLKHAAGELIDHVTLAEYKDNKRFKPKAMSLKREFFKHCSRFTDKDFEVFAQHMLSETPNRKALYPKVSVLRMKILVVDNHASADWVERRKCKKVVLQDFMALKPSLDLIDAVGDVVDDSWKAWKARHMFSSASWDFLLSYSKAEYFKRRLQNKAWTRGAKDLEKQLPEVLHMFNRFMKLKYQLPKPAGGVQIRGVDSDAKALVRSKVYQYVEREVNLAVMDIREVPRGKETKVSSGLDQFLEFVVKELDPAVTQPNVWLLICQDQEDVKECMSFVAQHLKEYEHALSSYIPSKAEMLNNVSSRGKSPHVPLVFLFKKDNDFMNASKAVMRSLYDTPAQCMYYLYASRNT